MKLEEAINHCKEVAKSKCDSCGAEHEQLAEWLIELKERREQEDKEDEERSLEIERDEWEREN